MVSYEIITKTREGRILAGACGGAGHGAGGSAGVDPLALHQAGSGAWLQRRGGAPIEVKQEQECGSAEQQREEYLRADVLWDWERNAGTGAANVQI